MGSSMVAAVMTLWLVSAAGAPPKPSPEADAARLEKLLQGSPDEKRRAFDFVMAHTASTPAVQMFVAAPIGLELGRLEDAAFLFFAAKIRSRFDLERFPPVEQGSGHPNVLISALSQQIGSAINPALMREPRAYKAVVERLHTMDIQTASGYDPGWTQAIAQLKARGYPNPADADQFVGAALQGKQDLVDLFLAAGMPVDRPNHLGDHAFLMAIRGSYIDLAAGLLQAGADPRLADENGVSPLIELSEYCDETSLFGVILKAGVDVNARTRGGQTALQRATQAGCADMVRMLKKAGAAK